MNPEGRETKEVSPMTVQDFFLGVHSTVQSREQQLSYVTEEMDLDSLGSLRCL